MSFTDPDTHRRRSGDLPGDFATIEFGHEGTRDGIVLQLDGDLSSQRLRMLLESAFDLAGSRRRPEPCSPGWWAVVVGWAAMDLGGVRVQRSIMRAKRHAVVRVERVSLLQDSLDWPMARFAPSGPWLDLRGETALAHGPGPLEVEAYRLEIGGEWTAASLLQLWRMGVVEFRSGQVKPGERRGLCRARA